mgnify:CR=1 FL=1
MTLVFLTNFINHHQVHVADEFYKLLGDGYKFIATEPVPDAFIQKGYPIFERNYLVKAYEDKTMLDYAYKLAEDADVAIIGSAPESFVRKRLEANKLTFHYSERWFKSGYKSLLSPRFWRFAYKYHLKYRNSRSYMLCASAYTAHDVNLIGAYKNKCFRWGYFTKVEDLDINELSRKFNITPKTIHFMWCARFLKFKHPELPVKLAARLKSKGYKFMIDMFGSGEELEATKNLAKKLNVEDVVNFCGSKPNDEILAEMRRHDIFLFTSDRNEGWGAVLNEAMSNGCSVVVSDKIGAVPFLIDDGVNGCIFKSCNLDSLEQKVIFFIEHPSERQNMARSAYHTMSRIWSPANAARQFIQLVYALMAGDESGIPNIGPGTRV